MPKATFDKIAPDKQERILQQAAALFAERGFAGTDIAEVAARSGIAKGSIYNYFESKDDLYLHVCRDGLLRSRRAVYGDLDASWDVYRQIDHIFRAGLRFVTANPEYVVLYLNVSSPGMARFSEELTLEVESHTAAHLKTAIREGIERGVVKGDVDVDVAAFFINSMYITLMASLVSPHFRLRLERYLDLDLEAEVETIESLVERVIDVAQGLLRPMSVPTGQGANRGGPGSPGLAGNRSS